MEIGLIRPSGADDEADLRRLVHDELLRRVAADVHVAADVPDLRSVRAAAVRAVLPERLVTAGAVLCGADAAWLHASGPPPEELHVAMPLRRGRAGAPLVVVHEARLADDDVEVVDGVRVTTPSRTAADVARTLAPDVATLWLRRLATSTRLDHRDVLVHLERLRSCRGVEEARRTVLEWAPTRGVPTRGVPAQGVPGTVR